MEARVFKREKSIVLELRGRVDAFHGPLIKTEIRSYISSGKIKIGIDLSKVSHLDPSCLRDWLFQHFELVKLGRSGGIALVNPSKAIADLIYSSEIESVMPIIDRIEDLNTIIFPVLKEQKGNPILGSIFGESRSAAIARGLSRLKKWIYCLLLFISADFTNEARASALVSFSLDEAQKLARERSPLIRLARARYTEKDASFEIARKSPLPKLSSTLGYLYQSNPNAITDIINKEANSLRSGSSSQGINEIQTRNQVKFDKNVFVVGVAALQVIYAGGFFDAKQSLADGEKELSEIDVAVSEQELDSFVRDAFIGIVLLEKKLELEKVRVEVSKKRFEAMRAASESLPKMVTSEAEIAHMAAEREMENTREELTELIEKFNSLLGRPIESKFKLNFQADQPVKVMDASEVLDKSLSRNPVMAQALKRVSMSQSYINMMKSQEMFVPKVFTFGGVDHTKGIGSDTRFLNWSAGLGVVIPLIDGGVQNEETRKALALRSQAELSFQIEEQKLRQSLTHAFRKLRHSQQDFEMAKKVHLVSSMALLEAKKAASDRQIPQYKYEEIRLKEVEAELQMLASETETLRWSSVLQGLMGARK